ncbi:hypothetical protein ACFQH6_01775 [Halobacteriaceae archaeon GCM10025711]
MQSSRWYLGLDYLDGVAERELMGVVFPQLRVQYQEGQPVRMDVVGFYGDEQKNTSLTPGSLVGKDDDPMVFHGATLSIPSATAVAKLQSGTLNIQTGAHAQRGAGRHPVDAVLGGVNTTLDVTDIITDTSKLELAYGAADAPATTVSGAADASFKFTTPGTSSLDFQLSGVTPNEYSWNDFTNPDTDVTEQFTNHVTSVTAIAESDEASAL